MCYGPHCSISVPSWPYSFTFRLERERRLRLVSSSAFWFEVWVDSHALLGWLVLMHCLALKKPIAAGCHALFDVNLGDDGADGFAAQDFTNI